MSENDSFIGDFRKTESVRFSTHKAQLLAAIEADDFEVFADALGEIEAIHQHTENENLRRNAFQLLIKAGRSEVGPVAANYMQEVGGFEMPSTWLPLEANP